MGARLRAPNTSKLKRGGHEGKRAAARQDGARDTQFCGRRMAGPLSLAAHLLGSLGVPYASGKSPPQHEEPDSTDEQEDGVVERLVYRQISHMVEFQEMMVDHPLHEVEHPPPSKEEPGQVAGRGRGVGLRPALQSRSTPQNVRSQTPTWNQPSARMLVRMASMLEGGTRAESMLCQWRI